MIWTYRTIHKLLTPSQRYRFWLLVVLLLAMGVLDLAGVAMILPFLAVLADPTIVEQNEILSRAFAFLGSGSTYVFLQVLGAATFLLVILGITVRALGFYLMNVFLRSTNMVLGMARLRTYLAQPYEWFLEQHPAELSKSVLQEVNEIVNGTVAPALRIIGNMFLLLALSCLLFFVEPVGAAGIAILFGASFWFVDRAMRRRVHAMGVDRRLANRERHQVAGEALSGIKEVKLLGLERAYLERFFDPSLRLANHQTRLSLLGEMPRFLLEAMTFGGMLLFTLWLLWANDGMLEGILPTLGAFAFAGLRLMPTVQTLFADISKIRFGRAALAALETDLVTLDSMPHARALNDDTTRLSLCKELRLEDVNYIYPNSDQAAIRDLDLVIPAGTTVGLVGATGAGKSTVTDLILGLVKPRTGRFLIDGVPIDDNNRQAWQREVGLVPQNIYLVDDSISANIAFGIAKHKIDVDLVREAARMASIASFVEGLSNGYDTFVGDRGIRLSGGQRQRIGIARALYRDQSTLVFDEATSALDTVTEREVMESVRGLHGHKTLILVSHRLSALIHCDRIFVLRDRHLVASGTHEELRKTNIDFQLMLTGGGEH